VAPNVAGSIPVSHPNLTNFDFPLKSHAFVVFRPVPICPAFRNCVGQNRFADSEFLSW
jgi:hypothetical protein